MQSAATTILYRADGSPQIGTGHIIRGLILRRRIEALGARVVFLIRDLPWGLKKLRDAGCEVPVIPAHGTPEQECELLRQTARSISANVCVMDVLETSEAQTGAARDAGCRIVCLDDVGAGRLNADAVINVLEVEPTPDLLTQHRIALYEGPRYMALTEEYEELGIAKRQIPPKVRRILITLGGADPAGLAPKAARGVRLALESERARDAFDAAGVLLIVGSASHQRADIEAAVSGARARFTLATSLPLLLPALREADLGIIAGGLTMHEALAVGLPSIALCQPVRHQAELAQRFADQGAMLTLGPGAEVREAEIAETVLTLASDVALRRRLADRGPQLVDGRGAQRTADIIWRAAKGSIRRNR
jgi:UDP-2,4-diacetamido-2,4,6-trideoxy-beta-L-altropyranose hydrolase